MSESLLFCARKEWEYVEASFTGRKEDSESVPAEGTHGEISGNFYHKVTLKKKFNGETIKRE